MSPSITRQAQILKQLRKRQAKSLHDLAEEIGHGTTVKHLTTPIAQLVGDGAAIRHHGRPATYTKA